MGNHVVIANVCYTAADALAAPFRKREKVSNYIDACQAIG